MTYTYALTSGTSVIRSDSAIIPADPNNADYQIYLAWLAAGNTPTPYTPDLLTPFIASVQSALDDTDTTMHRINEAVSLGLTTWTTADVVTFVNYRRALRALLKSTTVGVLPTKPAYPVGG